VLLTYSVLLIVSYAALRYSLPDLDPKELNFDYLFWLVPILFVHISIIFPALLSFGSCSNSNVLRRLACLGHRPVITSAAELDLTSLLSR
jgi:hypothetical protein